MNRLMSLLREGDYSLIVRSCSGEITTYSSRGVMDLYNIIVSGSAILRDAEVADKVVGAGAAALMVAGGVKTVYAGVMSRRASDILRDHDVAVEAERVVSQIINRDGTGRCPVEVLLDDTDIIDVMVSRIGTFVENLKKPKSEVVSEQIGL